MYVTDISETEPGYWIFHLWGICKGINKCCTGCIFGDLG